MLKEFKTRKIYKKTKWWNFEIPRWIAWILKTVMIWLALYISYGLFIYWHFEHFIIDTYNFEYIGTPLKPILSEEIDTRIDLNWNEFNYQEIQIWDITMMDRNLWATSNNINSEDSYGYYYQWWNNYWFNWIDDKHSENKVELAEKWYFNDVFITNNSFWLINSNDNLWWNITNTEESRQWPCPEWWHIPTYEERKYVFGHVEKENYKYLMIPWWGYIKPDWKIYWRWSAISLRTSTTKKFERPWFYFSSSKDIRPLSINSWIGVNEYNYNEDASTFGLNARCFKNR